MARAILGHWIKEGTDVLGCACCGVFWEPTGPFAPVFYEHATPTPAQRQAVQWWRANKASK